MAELLFLCTGNYYRSRFAEILFNSLATDFCPEWQADSCGLALERGLHNVGPISTAAVERLAELGITCDTIHRMPRSLQVADLERVQHVVAVKEAEHRELLTERFPGWADRVEYWHIHDIDFESADTALTSLEQHVRQLVQRLAAAGSPS
ncbi:MAG: low molecular weight phosphatase family protein [Planctomycetaceae bacterium]|nr:low molecular weight phosphatase family protein [Planctomycetaceae bacterium]